MVSEIGWKNPFIKRIFLLQSLSQALSWFGFLVVVWIVVGTISVITGNNFLNIKYFSIAFLGSLPALHMTLPCIFYVDNESPKQVLARLEPVAWRLGYIISGVPSDDGGCFVSKLPRLLRWNENRIVIRASASGACVEAPKLVVKRIRQGLE